MRMSGGGQAIRATAQEPSEEPEPQTGCQPGRMTSLEHSERTNAALTLSSAEQKTDLGFRQAV